MSRRFVCAAGAALLARPAQAAGSLAAIQGAAPFETSHLIPGDEIDLSRLDMGMPLHRVVALTFDDGPDRNDRALVEILGRYGARATFFVVGRRIHDEGVAIVQEVVAAGHEIGNHTQNHPMMGTLSPAARRLALVEVNSALSRLAVRPVWFRPPYGDFDAAIVAEAAAVGLRTVLWTLDSRDWKGISADRIANRMVAQLHPGAVVLMHSPKTESTKALPRILEAGLALGLRFVTMSEWRAAMASPVVPVAAMPVQNL